MRFTTAQHQRILSLIQECQRSPNDFEFVKKKGRVKINHIPSKQFFAFIHVVESQLNPQTMGIEESVSYKIKVNQNQEVIQSDWELMCRDFKEWLIQLPDL